MTEDWEVVLPGLFQRRFEEEDLVLVRPGLEIRVAVWGNDQRASAEERVRWFADEAPDRAEERIEREGDLVRATWRTVDEGEEVLEGFVLADGGHVHVLAAPEDEAAVQAALAFVKGIRRHQPH